MAIEFSKESMLWFKNKLEEYDSKESMLLPTLHRAQAEFGYLSEDVVGYVSRLLQMPITRIMEVITFYHFFRTKPIRKNHLEICTSLTCWMKGSKDLKSKVDAFIAAKEKGGARVELTVGEVPCLGGCDCAPVATFNHQYQNRLTEASVDQILESVMNMKSAEA